MNTFPTIVDLAASPADLALEQRSILFTTHDVQVIRFVVPAGAEIPAHKAQGELILHCLQGVVTVRASGESHELRSDQLLCLSVKEAFAICGVEDASVLAMIILPKTGANIELVGG
ncbi:MAG: hypothetical protein HYX69_20525 [Planctomycetia bacterium]|nr:hypothetical protein [Planctomycetia bacterium]